MLSSFSYSNKTPLASFPLKSETPMDSYLNAADYSDEDYIDMEIFSQETIFCHSKSSPTPNNRQFEFQMFCSSSGKDISTSPADELFYQGKLFPLQFAPRLQMVEKLLLNHGTYESKLNQAISFEESYNIPLFTTSSNSPIANTPFESYISPVDSCQVSQELHPEEYLQDYLAENSNYQTGDDDQNPMKSWTKRLKLIKQSTLSSKLKASRAFLKSIFTKSGCSDKSSAVLKNVNESMVPKAEICKERHAIVVIKAPSAQIQKDGHQITSSVMSRSFKKDNNVDNKEGSHKRSFSGAFKRISSSIYTSSESSSGSSSTSSSKSNGFQDIQFYKRGVNTNLEVDNPIQDAIAHCKNSQQQFYSRNTCSDIEAFYLSASRILNEDQERPGP